MNEFNNCIWKLLPQHLSGRTTYSLLAERLHLDEKVVVYVMGFHLVAIVWMVVAYLQQHILKPKNFLQFQQRSHRTKKYEPELVIKVEN